MRRKRYGVPSLVLVICFLLSLTAMTSFVAASHNENVFVVSPSMDMSGVTDRENICSAFALAVAAGSGSVVELTAGEFVIDRPIQIADFDGVFRGAGMEDTLVRTAGIDPFPNAAPIQGVIVPPYMFTFYQQDMGESPTTGTEISICDMTLQTIGPAEFWGGYNIPSIIWITGRYGPEGEPLRGYVSASIDSVHLYGDWLMECVTFFGTNVLIEPGAPLMGLRMASIVGTFEVTNSRFESKRSSLWFTGLYDSRVRVSNNEFTSLFGMGGAAFTKCFASDIKVYRCEADNCAGVTIGRFDWYFEMLDTEPSRSRYYISRNTIHRDAPIPFGGIEMWDSPESPTIRAIIYHNTIVSPDHFAILGPIVGDYVDNALVFGNKFEGAGSSAINMLAGSGWLILSNDFRDYDSSVADIFLGPESSDCLVVGGGYPATVSDQGTGNTVVGRATRV